MDWFCLVLGLVWRDVVLSLMTFDKCGNVKCICKPCILCLCVCDDWRDT